MKAAIGFAAAAVVVLVAVLWWNRNRAPDAPPLPPRTQSAMLAVNVPARTLEAEPLGRVADWLRDATRLSVYVDWRALESAGLSREMTVTVDVEAGSLDAALQQILGPVSPRSTPVAYVVEQGVLTISTAARLAERTPREGARVVTIEPP